MPIDLILRGGRVIDPSQKLDAVTDVAFADGKVAMVGSELKADPGTDVRDVSGYIVTPGLIDLHTHVYWGGTSLGIDAEEFCRTSGVTTAVDTGSAGPGNFAGFRKHVNRRRRNGASWLQRGHASFPPANGGWSPFQGWR
jgi:dihydroorotase